MSVTSIGDEAFFCCSSLKSVTIPDSVTSIRDCAFMYCTSLESVTIPDSVTTIEATSFDGCNLLVIKCFENSYAHTYAVENDIAFSLIDNNTSGLTPDTIYKQTTTAVDGYYAARFIQMVKKTDLENVTSITYTITDGANTKTITGTSCFAAVMASGSTITADDGYVFIGVIVTGIPEEATLTCSMSLETAA